MKDAVPSVCLYRLVFFLVFTFGTFGLSIPVLGQSCTPVPSGLVGWWPGDGTATDIAGGFNGSLVGNATFGAGEVNQAFVFDGNEDAVQLFLTDGRFQLQSNFTIEVWVKRSSTNEASLNSGGGVILSAGASLNLFISDDGTISLGSLTSPPPVQSIQKVTDTLFHHLAVTVNGSAVVFYVDGVASATLGSVFFSHGPGVIGAGEFFNNSFLGEIDELSIYNRALGASEIQAIYGAGSAGKCDDLPPLITVQPFGLTVIAGNNRTLGVSAGGSPPLFFQWQFNSNNVPGATNSTLSLTNVQMTDAGNYSVIVSNAFGVATSSDAVITVIPAVCVTPPSGLVSWWPGEGNANDIVAGNNGTLQGNITFVPGRVGQAFNSDGNGSAVVDSNSAALQLQNFTIEAWIERGSTAQASLSTNGGIIFGYGVGGYAFGITDAGNLFLAQTGISVTNSLHQVTDTGLHHVAVVKSGSNVVFYLDDAMGGAEHAIFYNPVFQFTSSPAIGGIAGSSGGSFLGLVDEVSVYNRALSLSEIQSIYGAEGAGKCSDSPPVITVQPTAQTVSPGFNVIFNPLVAGMPPFSYQWQFNSNNVSGATNATLTLTNVQPADAGNYSVVVTNVFGTATSSNALLTVIPVITATQVSGSLILSWPASDSGFNLESTDNLTTPNWTAVGASVTTDGITDTVTISISGTQQFYRLHHP